MTPENNILDKATAEYLGWEVKEHDVVLIYYKDGKRIYSNLPKDRSAGGYWSPSRRMGDAWMVIEALNGEHIYPANRAIFMDELWNVVAQRKQHSIQALELLMHLTPQDICQAAQNIREGRGISPI